MKKLAFKQRLFFAVTILVTSMILIGFFVYRYVNLNNIKENEEITNKIILERVLTQIDELYNEMDVAASSLIYNSALKDKLFTLSSDDNFRSSLDYIQTKQSIEQILGSILFFPNISNVFLYNPELDYFFYSGNYIKDLSNISDILGENTYVNSLSSDSQKQFLSPHLSPWNSENPPVISLYRNFPDNVLLKNNIIEVQVPYRILDEICKQNSFGSDKEIIILDNSFNLVYPIDKDITVIDTKQLNLITQELKDNKLNTNNDSYSKNQFSFLLQKSSYTNLNIVLLSNNRYLKKQNNLSLMFTILITLSLLGVILIITFSVLKKLLTPLNELIDHINSLNINPNKKLSLSANGVDEFNIINDSFNNMVDKLKESTALVYEAQIKEVEASLRALQSQVNPHFIYNTLNSISAASDIFGSEVTQKMCQELSLMLRYTTSRDTESKLIDEIKHTRNYLELMKISHMGDFDYDMDVSIETYDFKLPKLIIQPIVENCFKHGFKEIAPPWHISIKSEVIGEYFRISISDNGLGFKANALEDFNKFKNSNKDTNYLNSYKELSIGGLGLKNIYSRLALLYKDKFNLTIICDEGCTIIIERGIKID